MPEMTRRAAADDMKDLECASGEVGIFQRFRIFCLGTAASRTAHLSRSSRSSNSRRRQDHLELRVTFDVTPSDLESAQFPPSPHPSHSHSTTNETNAESHVPLLIAPC